MSVKQQKKYLPQLLFCELGEFLSRVLGRFSVTTARRQGSATLDLFFSLLALGLRHFYGRENEEGLLKGCIFRGRLLRLYLCSRPDPFLRMMRGEGENLSQLSPIEL